MASSNIYSSLEPGAQSILGSQASFTIGQTGSLGDIFNLISRLGVTVLFLAFFTMLVYAFSKRIAVLGELSDKNISDSKKIATRAIYSFLITIGCFALIAKTVNPILSTDNILFSALSVGVSKGVEQGNSGTSVSCPNADSFKNSLISGANICAGFSCEATIACDTQTYTSIISQESAKQGVDPKLVTVIMCKESKGNKNAINTKNSTGGVDCGLMQINKPGSNTCSPEDLDPVTNIIKGISKIKEKYKAISQTYPGIDKEMMVAASYNCCGGGDNPNSSSVDCTTASGFPYTLPKWGCPINPGPTSKNMCSVRGYVCNISSCLNQLKQ